jgi:hypothetical protein
VGLCMGSYLMHRASLRVLAGVSSQGFRPGEDEPVEDVCDERCCGVLVASIACWILLLVHAICGNILVLIFRGSMFSLLTFSLPQRR